MILDGKGPLGEFREIEFTFPFIYMIAEPPGGGLYIGIPGIDGFVAVAVVSGYLERLVNIIRYGVFG